MLQPYIEAKDSAGAEASAKAERRAAARTKEDVPRGLAAIAEVPAGRWMVILAICSSFELAYISDYRSSLPVDNGWSSQFLSDLAPSLGSKAASDPSLGLAAISNVPLLGWMRSLWSFWFAGLVWDPGKFIGIGMHAYMVNAFADLPLEAQACRGGREDRESQESAGARLRMPLTPHSKFLGPAFFLLCPRHQFPSKPSTRAVRSTRSLRRGVCFLSFFRATFCAPLGASVDACTGVRAVGFVDVRVQPDANAEHAVRAAGWQRGAIPEDWAAENAAVRQGQLHTPTEVLSDVSEETLGIAAGSQAEVERVHTAKEMRPDAGKTASGTAPMRGIAAGTQTESGQMRTPKEKCSAAGEAASGTASMRGSDAGGKGAALALLQDRASSAAEPENGAWPAAQMVHGSGGGAAAVGEALGGIAAVVQRSVADAGAVELEVSSVGCMFAAGGPNAVPYSATLWACVGDPANRQAAVARGKCRKGNAVAGDAGATMQGDDRQADGSCARELSYDGRSGAAANADHIGQAAVACSVSGAPAHRSGAGSEELRPDVGAYNAAIGAYLGDPADALSAVGGG